MDFNAKPINIKPIFCLSPWERPKITKGWFVRRPHSTHKRVFKKGRRIKTIAALDKHLSSGGWIFWGRQTRAVHPGWIMSWQYTMVRNSLGRMWKAVKIEEGWTNA